MSTSRFMVVLLLFIFITGTGIVIGRDRLLLLIMTTESPPELLEPKFEGSDVIWFDDYYTIQAIDEKTYAIGEPRYFQHNYNYLLLGEKEAVVFDAGTGQRDIRSVVASITQLPVTFIPSHLHYDHIGNEVIFARTALIDLPHLRERVREGVLQLVWYEHLGELEGYAAPALAISRWLKPGESIDLGDRQLTVLYTPGHTDDSISLLDPASGYLFSGDFIYPGPLYGFLPNSNMGDYLQGSITLQAIADDDLRIFGAHRAGPLGMPELVMDDLSSLRIALEAIRAGRAQSSGFYPVSYTVSDEILLLAEPPFLQSWQARYPELARQ
ncbi:MAG: MBL fold metallo-hydrolase [Gammaproteobacteria bacterium]|nr:MBL fold metallo-hydrolase [Gammaproteobacteria bacterium]MBT5203195.1 MBL fold metallo-hydrolase [Gammaproteobacteria bacterium]MBT5600690.1 MBL fold metallo-hydrolase [Gammaproteobacteria bacterium]MBT6246568.1 MBL fold metallo-hydrolase [Gammaproteobacteria bacterium]